MAGGPLEQNSELNRINIDVSGGGVHTGVIMKDNQFEAQFKNRVNYTGPPAREGSGFDMHREQNDGIINIRNEGSYSNHHILERNSFRGNVEFEQNINIQAPEQNDGGGELMDLR